MSDFVHLHVHSEYSLLDGLPHPADLAARASELQQSALALTDHGALFAAIEFYDACKANGVKPIIGIEAYLARRTIKDRDPKEDRNSQHVLLLAENDAGYHNLLKLASAAQLEGFYYYPRLDHALLEQYNAGSICTTGCPSSEIPRLLQDGRKEEARRAFAWYRDVFQDRFYVELQEHGIAQMTAVNQELIALAREFNVPLIATNDAHYLRPEDASAQDILLCIQTNTVATDPKRMRMDGSDYYLKSSDEMRAVWRELPEALSNTLLVAERCNVDLDFKGYRLPVFPLPAGFTAASYLRHLCEQGFKRRYPPPHCGKDAKPAKNSLAHLADLASLAHLTEGGAARERLEYELRVIHTMGFDTYFLIVWDLCRAAREKDIWFNVRGSAAGSIVAYCLEITNLDPLQHGLIFERFLNPGRISMPDIDLDFPDERRQEMIEYTVQKYGRANVAQIITFGTLGAKAAIRDVGRALAYPLGEVDQVAKLVPNAPHITIDESLEKVPEFRQVYESNDYIRKLIDNAKRLEGVARHASTHAAGVVVADKPIVEYVPLHRPTKGDESTGFPVTQFDMNMLERIGLLKIDFLGLTTLTIMRRACELIRARHGKEFNLDNIPVEDPQAFELLSRGDAAGVFQVEGAGLRGVLTRMKPKRFNHVVAAISLFRPGPMDKIPLYIARMHGEQRVAYDHPKLEPILDETYGVVVFQEQILRMAMELAGYTAADADLLRRAVGKKKREELLKQREQFVEGAQKFGGVPKPIADKLFDDLEFFARYGFNRAHAADYAVLTCQTAYLKAHYPLEYMAALLTTETGNIEKVGNLVNEARRMGIEILPPDVNTSDVDFTIAASGKAIHFGLSAIKNVGVGAVEVIVNARRASGPFRSLDDFCRRVDLRLVNRRVLESWIKAGALDRFGRRSQLLKVLDRMMAASQAAHQASERGQLSLFDHAPASAAGLITDTFGILPDEPELPNRQKLADEKEYTGAYFSDNPLLRLARQSNRNVSHLVHQLDETLAGQWVTLAGVVTSSRVITTKKGDAMAFVQLEDPSGTTEITVFPRKYARTKDLWNVETLVQVKGKVELRDGKVQVLCDTASAYQIVETSEELQVAARPSESASQPNVVQFAMPDEYEAVIADASAKVEETLVAADMSASIPLPPEEPPDELLAAPPVSRQQAGAEERGSQSPERSEGTGTGDASATAQQRSNAPLPPCPSAPFDGVYPEGRRAQGKPLPLCPVSDDRPRHLRIILARTNDHDEDVRRMRELFVLLTGAPGRDRFTFFIPNPQGMVQLDFPNHTTSYDTLQESLQQMMGEWGRLEVL